ncbi:putative metal-dependent hydrolase [Burkholderiales bacterium JOSHI_001]|nr:putative metal-dependent hydrolase [Burkholderiales bacterium JOSHI_001]
MTTLTVRRLLVDLEAPFPVRWNGGDAFRSAWFNALSMSFPAGEQFFIDSVREGLKQLPEAEREAFAAEVQGFIGQEATHRRVHGLFNAQLEKHGLVNHWEARVRQRMRRLEGVNIRHWVGVTAAVEHFTAILSFHLLAHPELLDGAEPRLRTLWLWHSAEESEHRSTAFDLYRALGGDEPWRRRWMRISTINFLADALRQTVNNLWHDGSLFQPGTWASAARFFWGRDGFFRSLYRPWKDYFDPGFHPRQQGGTLGEDWLRANPDAFTAVGARAAV